MPLSAAAGATAYQRLFGGVLAAYLLAKGASAARRLRSESNASVYTPGFLDAKAATARFYCEQLLPSFLAQLGPATAGAETIFGVGADVL